MGLFNSSSRQLVETFLANSNNLIAQNRVVIVPRQVNLDFIERYGLRIGTIYRMVATLTFAEYVKGPDPDRNHEGEWIWVFIRREGQRGLYFKLQIRLEMLFIISIHESKENK